jgi:hypothetical protein
MTSPTITTNPDTGVRYYDEPGHPLNQQSVDFYVVMRGEMVTNAGGIRWPYINGLAIPDPDLRLYLKEEPKLRADDPAIYTYDSRWGAVDYDRSRRLPGGPAGTWEEELTAIRRSNEELFALVDSIHLQANAALYPENRLPMLQALYEEAKLHESAGTASPVHLQILQERDAVVSAGFANYERAQQLKADVLAGRELDLTVGWTHAIQL